MPEKHPCGHPYTLDNVRYLSGRIRCGICCAAAEARTLERKREKRRRAAGARSLGSELAKAWP